MARLVFLGTPEAAVAPLRTLVDAGHDVALVVSRADKRRGRGGGLRPSPVKQAALELGLPVTDSLDDAPATGAELGVVVAYGRIIPVAVLDRLPMVNLHFSLLPRWRGAAPVERAILEGDAETGVCLMAVEAGLDTGGIYAEDDDRDRGRGDGRRAAGPAGRPWAAGCWTKHLADGLAGLPVPRDQVGNPSYAEKIRPGELELRVGADRRSQLHRVVRVGRAWTTFRGRRLGVAPEPRGAARPTVASGPRPGTLRRRRRGGRGRYPSPSGDRAPGGQATDGRRRLAAGVHPAPGRATRGREPADAPAGTGSRGHRSTRR